MSKDSKKPNSTALKTPPVCPRCAVSLTPSKYEGVNADYCDGCWGYWLGLYQFETILATKDEVFSKEERQSSGKAAVHPGDGKPLVCARCERHMQKLQVKDEWGKPAFFLDYCKEHGLWLDTGEIKRTQILDERTGNVRKALRAAVGKGTRPVRETEDES
jgi:Zn-finger nucleic acid-binding protein